jgi:PleD family two-component response regulator
MENYLLIIDPDTQELRRLREILTREGYNIMTATDKETARQICERVPVHLVLACASTIGFDGKPK